MNADQTYAYYASIMQLYHSTLAQRKSHCVFINIKHRNSHSVHATLLVLPNGTKWTVMNLQGQENAACESRPGYLFPCHWCVLIVLECGFHVKQLVLSSSIILANSCSQTLLQAISHDRIHAMIPVVQTCETSIL